MDDADKRTAVSPCRLKGSQLSRPKTSHGLFVLPLPWSDGCHAARCKAVKTVTTQLDHMTCFCDGKGHAVGVRYLVGCVRCHLFGPWNMLILFPLELEPVLDADIG